MISICVGAFALAQAGILDGRPATTHWRFSDELAQQFPAIDVRADVLYVDDGDVLTSAGVSSGLDLCLHVVRTDLGVEEARRVAQELVAAPHRDGNQAQFIARPLQPSGVGPIGELCSWAKENLDEQITLDDMAARCAMSPRTLTRHFREATGTTPLRWLLTMRIDEARQLLEATDHLMAAPETVRIHPAHRQGVSFGDDQERRRGRAGQCSLQQRRRTRRYDAASNRCRDPVADTECPGGSLGDRELCETPARNRTR